MSADTSECERYAIAYAEKLQEVRSKMAADPRYAQYLRPCSDNLELALGRLLHADGGAEKSRVFETVTRVLAPEGVHYQQHVS